MKKKERLIEERKLFWKDNISILNSYLFNGEYENVQNWFDINKIEGDDEKFFRESLYNEHFLFSFRSSSTNLDDFLKESFKRESIFLRNVNINIALETLVNTLLDIKVRQEHIDIILKKKDLHDIEENTLSDFLLKLMNQKYASEKIDFNLLLNFKDFSLNFPKEILSDELLNPFDKLYLKKFNYKFIYDKNGTMIFNLDTTPWNISKCSLWVDLVANFSMEKLSFFRENNIFIPTLDDVKKFSDGLEKHMLSSNYVEQKDIELMKRSSKSFESAIFYENLTEKIPKSAPLISKRLTKI